MRIRPATIDDADALGRISTETWQVAYAGILPDEFLAGLDRIKRADGWRSVIESKPAPYYTYAAEVDGEVVGLASGGAYRTGGEPEPGIGEVYAIYVLAQHWSTGVGRALMQASVAALVDAGFHEIRLWVLEDNNRSRHFYERVGYRLDGARKVEAFGTGTPDEGEAAEVRYALTVS